ncbi:hypothetical protein K450DRAFT_295539 [Umbelopsis ramanniana AG]|uniref:mRNA 3'-end-processing protein n=1 Tax=Umbelopsis ramanniana AG TaxID=1314678 RepID=A0AAD5H9W1_UMBRA|nr:uncharacterized protein K450DRAFT_295539 [Umbelopsis ramanniana AG]KAI8576540.1 hypothetical protein K450DRAFT_295539 [Umbelopsis ramanniana AG]
MAAVLSPLYSSECRNFTFDFEEFIKNELGLDLDKPKKKEDENICKYFLRGTCHKGASCQYKHTRGDREKSVVCKHWLRGLCKKGEHCEFLHVFNMKKMPECWFYSKYGECCNGDECQYQHIDPESKVKECPWYARGFCKHGPNCRNKHVRKLICQNYLTGFCPLGLNCPNGHPRYELPVMHNDDRMDDMAPEQQQQPPRVPFTRGDQAPQQQQRFNHSNNAGPPGGGGGNFVRRPLEEVTCFKCGQQGHYANKCPNGRANVR